MPSSGASAADLRRVITLSGELAEISAVSLTDARSHLIHRISVLVGDSAIWWSISASEGSELAVVASEVHGVDEALVRRWQEQWLAVHSYREHPMWEPAYASRAAVTVRREEVVSARDWAMSPHVAEWSHALGLDDTVVSVEPLGPGAVASLTLVRPLRQPPYTARESELIALLQTSVAWMNRAAYDEVTKSPLELLRASLRQRYVRVLDELLIGRSEKEVAAKLYLSTRTIHKYVEHIYRVFSVSSRAELMALWIDQRTSTSRPEP
ncbi:MAG: hypothetical protein KF764_13105 [Labilithrix sp.]|nr:hypothetical protein [Labilithrix sp.]